MAVRKQLMKKRVITPRIYHRIKENDDHVPATQTLDGNE